MGGPAYQAALRRVCEYAAAVLSAYAIWPHMINSILAVSCAIFQFGSSGAGKRRAVGSCLDCRGRSWNSYHLRLMSNHISDRLALVRSFLQLIAETLRLNLFASILRPRSSFFQALVGPPIARHHATSNNNRGGVEQQDRQECMVVAGCV